MPEKLVVVSARVSAELLGKCQAELSALGGHNEGWTFNRLITELLKQWLASQAKPSR